jgi:hypothetical protein
MALRFHWPLFPVDSLRNPQGFAVKKSDRTLRKRHSRYKRKGTGISAGAS